LKMRYFGPEHDGNNINVNPIGLIVTFPRPYSTPQSEFSIKSYDRLK
jgi:hypothetical protein